MYVKEKFKKMPGRVQSDYLFGGKVVGLRVRVKAVLVYMECFDFFKEVSCLCGLPCWLSGKKKKKKNLPAKAGDVGSIPGSGRFPGDGNSNPLSISAWEIPWTEKPGGLQSIGSEKSQARLSN